MTTSQLLRKSSGRTFNTDVKLPCTHTCSDYTSRRKLLFPLRMSDLLLHPLFGDDDDDDDVVDLDDADDDFDGDDEELSDEEGDNGLNIVGEDDDSF